MQSLRCVLKDKDLLLLENTWRSSKGRKRYTVEKKLIITHP